MSLIQRWKDTEIGMYNGQGYVYKTRSFWNRLKDFIGVDDGKNK